MVLAYIRIKESHKWIDFKLFEWHILMRRSGECWYRKRISSTENVEEFFSVYYRYLLLESKQEKEESCFQQKHIVDLVHRRELTAMNARL